MNAERAHVGWAFWFGWVLASASGLVFSAVVGGAFLDAISTAVNGAMSGAAVGAAVGTAQWFVLRKHLSQAGWWVLATSTGFALFGAMGNVLDANVNLFLAFAVVGSAIGAVQWLSFASIFPKLAGGCWLAQWPFRFSEPQRMPPTQLRERKWALL